MSIQNLNVWWATDKKATDITPRLAGGIAIAPLINLDQSFVVGQNVLTLVPLGVDYVIAANTAYWDADFDGLLELNGTNGWLAVFDTNLDVGLVTPSTVHALPRMQLTADPARTMRTALRFVPTQDDRVPINASPDLTGRRQAVLTKASGIAITNVTQAKSAVTLASNGNSVTISGEDGV